MSDPNEDAIVREIMARGRAKNKPKDIPEDMTPYDWEILEIEKALAPLNAQQGLTRNLESFRKEAIERLAAVNWNATVEVYETDVDGVYAFDLVLLGRIEPISKTGESDFERRKYEVVNDVLEIAPELKGETIPFSEALVHNTALADPCN